MSLKTAIALFFILILTSCKTKKNTETDSLNYMQNIKELAENTALKNSKSTIQPGDQLEIYITAKDMDVVKPFNRQYSSSEHVSSSGGNVNARGNQNSPVVYLVDSNGEIDFSSIGTLSTTGKSLIEFKDELRRELLRYVKDPVVNIKLLNFKISVLGEVSRQSDIVMPNSESTIMNALAMAGDLTIYAKRNDIMIIRTEDGKITYGTIDLTDVNFVNSPYYFLKQGDVIYVKSNEKKQKIANQNPNLGTTLSVVSIGLTTAALIITILLNTK